MLVEHLKLLTICFFGHVLLADQSSFGYMPESSARASQIFATQCAILKYESKIERVFSFLFKWFL
jgi:hypothetical protein